MSEMCDRNCVTLGRRGRKSTPVSTCLLSISKDEAGPLPKKDVNLLESDIFDPLAEDQKPDPPAPPASNPASNPAAASRSPRHAYSHPDYEERPDGGQRDEVDHRGGAAAAAGNASIVPTQKMLQDKYEQNLRCVRMDCWVKCFRFLSEFLPAAKPRRRRSMQWVADNV